MMLVLFAILQLLVPGVQLHRVPAWTSVFLWATLVLAILTGVLFRDRAFCRGFCPVALLLNAYGRGGVLAVRSASGAPCDACADRGCAAERNRTKGDARSCPSLLNPPRLDTNADCLLCGQCLKSCRPGNLRLLLRAPYSAADVREPLASWSLTLFVMVASGFVTYELCGVSKAADAVFLWVPNRVREVLDAGPWGGWLQGAWTVMVFPVLAWLVLGWVTRLAGGAKSPVEAWRRLALPLAVVVAAGHMAKGLEKFTSWAGFLPHALRDPDGVQTVLRVHANTVTQPPVWLTPSALSLACLLLVGVAVGVAVREARLADRDAYRGRVPAILLLGGFYFFLIAGWGPWF